MQIHKLLIPRLRIRRWRSECGFACLSHWKESCPSNLAFLLLLLLFIGCPLIHGYSTNSLLSVIIASTRLLLTTWLNSWESISQPTNFTHLLIHPFSVFPLYAHTRLVKGYFLMLHRQSGTLSLTKSDHPTPSHPSNHHLKLIFFSSPTDCVWVCVWVYVCACVCVCVCVCVCERGGRGRERERERERELVVYCKVWVFLVFVFFHLFCLI